MVRKSCAVALHASVNHLTSSGVVVQEVEVACPFVELLRSARCLRQIDDLAAIFVNQLTLLDGHFCTQTKATFSTLVRVHAQASQ